MSLYKLSFYQLDTMEAIAGGLTATLIVMDDVPVNQQMELNDLIDMGFLQDATAAYKDRIKSERQYRVLALTEVGLKAFGAASKVIN